MEMRPYCEVCDLEKIVEFHLREHGMHLVRPLLQRFDE